MDYNTFERTYLRLLARDGALLEEARLLARTFGIASAVQSVRLTRAIRAAGEALFRACDRIEQERAIVLIGRARREGRLAVIDLEFCQLLIRKAKTSW